MHKKTFVTALLAVGSLAAGLSPAWAQLPVSRPAGSITTTLKGSGGFSALGLSFTREPALRDVVAGSAGTTITGTGGGYGSFTATPHSVVIQTGANRGTAVRITANTADTVTLASAIGGLVNNSDAFEIVPEWTFGSFFGTGPNPSGLASNANSNLADLVYIGEAGSLVPYFHNGNNWRRVATAANANNTSLGGLNGGSIVLKRSPGDILFNVQGVLRSGRQIGTVPSGFSVVTYTEASSATLGTSGLVPGVLVPNANSNLADIVYVPDVNGSLVPYFNNGSNWRRVATAANQNALPIKTETALIINKRSSGTSQWIIDERFFAGP